MPRIQFIAIPEPINDATILCLRKHEVPHYTENNSFENGIRGQLSTAVYYCENAMVIADNRRTKDGDTIVYFLKDVSSGQIIGSNKYKNIFFIGGGDTNIVGGNFTQNTFMLSNPLFLIHITGGAHSTNIIDLSLMSNYSRTIHAEFEQRSCIGGRFRLKLHNMKVLNDRIKSQNYIYTGRTKIMDEVSCFTACENPTLLINAGGGVDRNKMDVIRNCKAPIERS